MLKELLREFRTAPLGTTSACLGLLSFSTASVLSASLGSAMLGSPSGVAVGLTVSVATGIALAIITTYFMRSRTPAWKYIGAGCALLLGATIELCAEMFGLEDAADPAQLLPFLVLAAALSFSFFLGIVAERYFAEAGEKSGHALSLVHDEFGGFGISCVLWATFSTALIFTVVHGPQWLLTLLNWVGEFLISILNDASP